MINHVSNHTTYMGNIYSLHIFTMFLLHVCTTYNQQGELKNNWFSKYSSDVSAPRIRWRPGQAPPLSLLPFLNSYTFCKDVNYSYTSKDACGPGSSVGIATGYGLDGPGIESRWGARFSAPVQTGPGAHPTSCTMGTGSFPGGKEQPGRDADPSPPSSAVGHERVELYLYSPYEPYGLYKASVPVQGWTLPFKDAWPFCASRWIRPLLRKWAIDYWLHCGPLKRCWMPQPALTTATLSWQQCHWARLLHCVVWLRR